MGCYLCAFGATKNASLSGVSVYYGGVLEGDVVGQVGVKAEGSTALTSRDSNGNGKLDLEDKIVVFTDPLSGRPVSTWQLGLAAGVDPVPNLVDGGVFGGLNVTIGVNIIPGWGWSGWIWNWPVWQ